MKCALEELLGRPEGGGPCDELIAKVVKTDDRNGGSSVQGILQTKIRVQVAIPFSKGSSQPRNQVQVYHTAGGFFTI